VTGNIVVALYHKL